MIYKRTKETDWIAADDSELPKGITLMNLESCSKGYIYVENVYYSARKVKIMSISEELVHLDKFFECTTSKNIINKLRHKYRILSDVDAEELFLKARNILEVKILKGEGINFYKTFFYNTLKLIFLSTLQSHKSEDGYDDGKISDEEVEEMFDRENEHIDDANTTVLYFWLANFIATFPTASKTEKFVKENFLKVFNLKRKHFDGLDGETQQWLLENKPKNISMTTFLSYKRGYLNKVLRELQKNKDAFLKDLESCKYKKFEEFGLEDFIK